ncbi:MAG: hypothetical protein LUD72_11005, partial [Bacteroidales bacterium]|nr:hypothetical protein [Bacteroidales bacterium]
MEESESEKPKSWLRSLPTEKLSAESTVTVGSPQIVSENDFAKPDKSLKKAKRNRYRLAAIKYAEDNHLFGEYTNNSGDKGPVVIQYDRKGSRRTKGGLQEILYNGKVTAGDIESTAVIPQIIEKGIYLRSAENEKRREKPGIVRYHYYMCGLKIGDSNYVVAFNVAEQRDSKNRYYFHKLVLQRESESGNELAQDTSSPSVASAIMNQGVSDSELTNRGETPSSTPVSE